MKKVIVLSIVMSLIFLSCGISKEEHNKLKQELEALRLENSKLKEHVKAQKEIGDVIKKANEKFMEAFKKSAAEVAALYTLEAQLLPPNSEMVKGKEAIQGFWQAVMDMGIKLAKLETVEVYGCGDAAYEIGKFELFAEGDKSVDTGKYIVFWKMEEGAWKLDRDIWNSSLPAKK
jgi:ketosteroid isomerase-like protein